MIPKIDQLVLHPEQDCLGTVIELDTAMERARVKWPDKRTWIAFRRLRSAPSA